LPAANVSPARRRLPNSGEDRLLSASVRAQDSFLLVSWGSILKKNEDASRKKEITASLEG
jgi:hypothetical protein